MALDIKHPPVRRTEQHAQLRQGRSAWEVAAWIGVVACGVAALLFTFLVVVTEEDAAPRTILTGQSARGIEGPIEAELGPVQHLPRGTSQRALEGPVEAALGWGAGPPNGVSVRALG